MEMAVSSEHGAQACRPRELVLTSAPGCRGQGQGHHPRLCLPSSLVGEGLQVPSSVAS